MKIYGSESANGSAPPIDPDEPDDIDEEWAGEDREYDFSTLFNAPNYADFIKLAPNDKARSYERRVASMMKAGLIASVNNQQWPDAATFLKYGPGFATAAGNLAAVDSRAAGLINMLTAPNSPYVLFGMVAFPLVSQLFRNHQGDAHQAAETWRERRAQRKYEKAQGNGKSSRSPITVHVFKREIKLPIRFRLKLPSFKNVFGAFLAPTQNPNQLAHEVLTDPAVIKALHKLGVFPREAGQHDNAA